MKTDAVEQESAEKRLEKPPMLRMMEQFPVCSWRHFGSSKEFLKYEAAWKMAMEDPEEGEAELTRAGVSQVAAAGILDARAAAAEKRSQSQ